MAARSIEYVELYVADVKVATDYFVSALGFAEAAHSESNGNESTLLRQGEVNLVVTAGPVTFDFLETHGDGVSDIAFACDDVDATKDEAVAAGARQLDDGWGGPVVSGFGDVRHTLLPSPPLAGQRLPAGHAWIANPLPKSSSRIKQLDHVAICMGPGEMQDGVRFYIDGFGLERYSSEYIQVGDQAMDSIVVRSPSNAITFTILEPDVARQPGQVDAFLGRNNGPGVQHLAFLVEDIVAAVRDFGNSGVEFLTTPSSYYALLHERLGSMREEIGELRDTHVLADRDEWGYLLQLFSRSPHPRNTLFYELIQRRGARGFGSANIRALYEAVERDRLVAE
jgi:4-hydroxymandelate synthase